MDDKTDPGAGRSFPAESFDEREARSRGEDWAGGGKPALSVESVQQAIGQVADQARATVSQIGDQAREAYEQASEKARELTGKVDPFVKEQPYAALGLAAVAGLVLGLLMAGRGPKTIYVKSKS